MANYILFDVDEIEVSKSSNGFSIRFKYESDRASIYLTKEKLKKLIDYAQAELQNSELVEEGVK